MLLPVLSLGLQFALVLSDCNTSDGGMNSQSLARQLLQNYDRDTVPLTSGGGSLLCDVEVMIQEVRSLSQERGQFSLDVWFSQIWTDPMLRYDHLDPCRTNLSLDFTALNKLWTPNVCFVNSYRSKVHISPSPNVLVMIFPNGTTWINYRVEVSGPCLVDLSYFPMDSAECELVFESYSYNSAEVKIRWWPVAPVTFIKPYSGYRVPEFSLVNHSIGTRQLPYTAGMWDQLFVRFKFKRTLGYYIFQSFIPTAVCVVMSWMAFFLPTEAVRARISLGVMSVSALVFTIGNITAGGLPKTSGLRALDVWIFTCMFFNFLSLLELAMASFADKMADQQEKPADLQDHTSNMSAVLEGELRLLLDTNPYKRPRRYSTLQAHSKYERARKFGYKIDTWASRLFPLAFLCFNLFFWYKYLISAPDNIGYDEL